MNLVFRIIKLILNLYTEIIIIRAIFSFLYTYGIINTSHMLVESLGQFLYNFTEPCLKPIRKIIPPFGGMFANIDISPIILLIIISMLQYSLKSITYYW
ncbi:MAG: YggT family protein [Candidatus Liberibacter ctenarytainae]|uniref:YggT family protein n=1 Tax=Candidatus Liberibacter ctenarytainae TaxID=2020335 RepID=A0A937AJS9_9HYPH|nr:YggT family protein [Candidatus Liberibacter ctenarytainae]